MKYEYFTLGDIRKEIGDAPVPMSKAMEEKLRDRIESSAAILAPVNTAKWFEGLQNAEAKRQFAENRMQETRAGLEQAREELRTLAPARLLKFLIFTICWLACAAGEFALTWSTIPFVLDIAEDSALGIAISAVVVAMLTVVEWVIARALEEPYQLARESMTDLTHTHRRVAFGLMAAFLMILLAGNLHTVKLLASAREESVKLRHNLERQASEEAVKVDEDAINRAITAVSLAVVIDGAILFLAMMYDLKNLDRRMRAALRAFRHVRRLPGREREFLEARAEEGIRRQAWDERDVRIALLQAEHREQSLTELQKALDRTPPAVSTEEMVSKAISRGVVGNAA